MTCSRAIRVDDAGARAFAAARTLLGAPFRMQGRDAPTGLDCVGLVEVAYRIAGRPLIAPRGYPLRGWGAARVVGAIEAAGFAAISDAPRAGDVALIAPGAGQWHLGLIGPDRVIHAHAGLRRVVEAPLDDRWRRAARWRLTTWG